MNTVVTENFTPNAISKLAVLSLSPEHRDAVTSARFNQDRDVYEVSLPQSGIDALMAALRGAYAQHVASGGAPYAKH